MSASGRSRVLLVIVAALQLTAEPCRAQGEPSDPWEKANRGLFAVHNALDRAILAPVAHLYGHLPRFLRLGVRNASRNLSEPLVFVNDVLQVHGKRAIRTFSRFTMNSTIGLGGLLDPANRAGLPHRDNDFGLTLGRWGVGPGPYLFIPLAGPSSVRDGIGAGVDIAIDPFSWLHYHNKTTVQVSTTLAGGINRRWDADRDLKTLFETSTDPYATIRSYYLQQRYSLIHGETIGNLPDFDLPEGAPPPNESEARPLAPPAPNPPSPNAEPAAPVEPAPAPSAPAPAEPGPPSEAAPTAPQETPPAPPATPDGSKP
jgi:phospholipid-binding lipoprotein MlaA